MFETFLMINLKILAVLMIYGLLMGKIRIIAYRNLWKKTNNYYLIDFLNLIGTPVHEMGHLIFGLLFAFKIDKVCLYRTMKQAKSHGGTLGFVKMHHKQKSLFQRFQTDLGQFFIGIGPLIFGPVFLYLMSRLLPESIRTIPLLLKENPSQAFQGLRLLHFQDTVFLLFFIYIAIGVSINMELSAADFKMAKKGFLILEVIFLIISIICYFLGLNSQMMIQNIFRYVLALSCIGTFCGLLANLFALI